MLVINRTEFPVAIPYKDGRVIIPADRNPHEIPDEFYHCYEEFLFCIRPPVKKPEPIVETPKKPLDDVRIKLDLIVPVKNDFDTTSNAKQNYETSLKIKRSTRGKKRDWGRGKKSQNKLETGKALLYDPKNEIVTIQTSAGDVEIPLKTEGIGNIYNDKNKGQQIYTSGTDIKDEFYKGAELTNLFKDVTKEVIRLDNIENNRIISKWYK